MPRFFLLSSALLLAALVGSPTFAAAGFTGVGDLPGGAVSSQAFGVSGDGLVVVGQSDSASGPEAFRWRVVSGIEGLGVLPGPDFESVATDASTDGSVIVGQSTHDLSQGGFGFRWTEAGGIQAIGPLLGPPLFHTSAGAHAVSGDGDRIVGDQTLTIWYDYDWTASGGYVDLSSDGMIYAEMEHLLDVSTDGSAVVGWLFNTPEQSFDWVAHRNFAALSDSSNPLTLTLRGEAAGTSADGSVLVGQYFDPFGSDLTTAFRWEASASIGLGTLGGATSRATATSGDGWIVVGWGDTATAREAFLWDAASGTRSLAAELTAEGVDLTGWTLEEATSVSDHGNVIVGWGVNPSGDTEGFVAVRETACSNGVDDDGDGETDLDDFGCDGASDLSERTPFVLCDDGLDNDGDGAIDFGADAGCKSAQFNLEAPVCQNGLDDDSDGKIDFDGGAAANGGVPLGPADPQCGTPWRPRESGGGRCGLGAELAVVLVALAALRRRAVRGRQSRCGSL